MKVVILAGGMGTRISEETTLKPKPMTEIGGHPMLWHIMKIYSAYGLNEFIICLGYRGYIIKEFFANYYLHMSDVTIDLKHNDITVHHDTDVEPWRVTLVDTGENTMTGGRLKRIQEYVGDEPFCMTYGDGVGDINIQALIDFHKKHGKLATVTATKMPGRFGALTINGNSVISFSEKPEGDNAWISGGFFVLSPKIFDYIKGDETIWERGPVEQLANESQMDAYFHTGFWHPMDTLQHKNYLENLWVNNKAPWKIW